MHSHRRKQGDNESTPMVKTLVDIKGRRRAIYCAMGSHAAPPLKDKGCVERPVDGEDVGCLSALPWRSSRSGALRRLPLHRQARIERRLSSRTTRTAAYYLQANESGLMKMITIGLGKQAGAEICHELGLSRWQKM